MDFLELPGAAWAAWGFRRPRIVPGFFFQNLFGQPLGNMGFLWFPLVYLNFPGLPGLPLVFVVRKWSQDDVFDMFVGK